MATKIVTKNSSTASAVPTTSDLVQGELAVNVADKKLFTEDNSGAIIELADGVKLAGIEASADVTDTANVTAAGALMDSELTSEASVKALNQGVATTDSPAFAGLTVDTTTLAVDSTNNRVGIGTASPTRALDVVGDIGISGNIKPTAEAGNTTAAAPRICIGYDWDTGLFQDTANTIGFSTAGTERMRIDQSGRVGIGTSSPISFAGDCTLALNDSGGARLGLNGSSRFFYMGCDSGSDRLEIGRRISSNTTDSPDFVLNGSGQVGIGTTSPEYNLDVTAADNVTTTTAISVQNSSRNYGLGLGAYTLTNRNIGGSATTVDYTFDIGGDALFKTSNAERMRIDSSGNLLVGTTTSIPAGSSQNVVGVAIQGGDGEIQASSEAVALYANRKDTDGDIAVFRKNGADVGSIGVKDSDIYIGKAAVGLSFDVTGADGIRPFSVSGQAYRDNAIDLGGASARFDDIYATNPTINTSDRNEKQDIAELSDAEQRVAVACKGLLRKFRWKDSVAEKGDDARIHFGIIAQDLQAAFEAQGLDAGDYAMFISTTWTDEETNEEKTRIGVRYSELLAFIIAAL